MIRCLVLLLDLIPDSLFFQQSRRAAQPGQLASPGIVHRQRPSAQVKLQIRLDMPGRKCPKRKETGVG